MVLGVPKTGYMIESMVSAVAHNIKESIDKNPLDYSTPTVPCLVADLFVALSLAWIL